MKIFFKISLLNIDLQKKKIKIFLILNKNENTAHQKPLGHIESSPVREMYR